MWSILGFYTTWIGFWATVIALLISIYALAFVDTSIELAAKMKNNQAIHNMLDRLAYHAYLASDVIFGKKLVSIRAFLSSMLLVLYYW